MTSWERMLIDRATELGRQLSDDISDSSPEFDVSSGRRSLMVRTLAAKFDYPIIPPDMDRPSGRYWLMDREFLGMISFFQLRITQGKYCGELAERYCTEVLLGQRQGLPGSPC
ncbi:unnamed protein product [Lupinus luteus]|uniref:Uncharacterized protein n=1 Tax=Lupinus luteus TaxID=3873 RepID=A0AAV1W6V9_LUPLU